MGSSGTVVELAVRLARPVEYDRVAALTIASYGRDYDLTAEYRAELCDVAGRALTADVWVAEDAATGRLLGSVVTARPGERVGVLAGDGEFGFRMLAVDPCAQRAGVGRLLVEHVVQLARLRGAHRVVMNSGPQMTGAHRLYDRLGFVRMPARETYVLPDGRTLFAFGRDIEPVRDH